MGWSDWHPMNQQGINSVPESSGVYQLNSDNGTLYHGQTDKLKRRLGEHLNSSDSCIKKATKFVYQTTNDPEGLEEKILKSYKDKHGKLPPCNEQSS